MLRIVLMSMLSSILLFGCQFPLIEAELVNQTIPATPPIPDSPPPPPPAGYNPDEPSGMYISGTVINVAPDQLVITTSLTSSYTVFLTPHVELMQANGNIAPSFHVGDHVEVMGPVNHEMKTVEAEEVWINFVRVNGKLSDVQATTNGVQFKVQDVRQGIFLATINQRTRITLEGVTRGVHVDEVPWERVGFADVYGFKQKDGSVEAITLFLTYN